MPPLTPLRADLSDEVESCRDGHYTDIVEGRIPSGPAEAIPFPPIDVPRDVFTKPGTLAAFISTVEPWWRLDVLDALEQCIDDANGEGQSHVTAQ